jgi:hypothetical protein
MTIANTKSFSRYLGDGSKTAFATGFEFLSSDGGDITVKVHNLTTLATDAKEISTHYTVTGGSGAAGTVTMGTAPAKDEMLVLQRTIALTQLTDYVENEAFNATLHEDGLDKLTMIVQQLSDLADRTPQVPIWSTASPPAAAATVRVDRMFPAELLSAADSSGTYTWEQVTPDNGANTWDTTDGGAASGTFGRAREFEGCATASLGTIVAMMLVEDSDNDLVPKFIVGGTCA